MGWLWKALLSQREICGRLWASSVPWFHPILSNTLNITLDWILKSLRSNKKEECCRTESHFGQHTSLNYYQCEMKSNVSPSNPIFFCPFVFLGALWYTKSIWTHNSTRVVPQISRRDFQIHVATASGCFSAITLSQRNLLIKGRRENANTSDESQTYIKWLGKGEWRSYLSKMIFSYLTFRALILIRLYGKTEKTPLPSFHNHYFIQFIH